MSEKEKQDYGKSINLPTTDFPMRGNLQEREPEILKNIYNNGLYEKILEKNRGNKTFVLHDGPPYANGDIHMGHALNKVLKDTIVRYKSMKGFYSPFIPGYDTHGLPTEIKAIEALNLNREDIPVDVFRDTCKGFAEKYIQKQTESFKRLGVLGDWNNPYITYLPEVEVSQLEIFAKMYFNGYIYQGKKPVYWCTHCETALAEAEIEYKDVKSTSVFVKFKVEDSKNLFDKTNTYAVIWTTTPWTLPGNLAIVVGPKFKYSLVEVKEGNRKGEKYILLNNLVETLMNNFEITEYEIIDEIKAEELEGVVCKHPFLDRTSNIVLGSKDTVDVDNLSGTGLVHCAPGYGKEDYALGLKKDLGMIVCVDDKGHQTEEAGPFAGMYYKKSNKEIVNYLEENGSLLYKQEIDHSYPHCWRCKNPVIFRATKQWFASVKDFRNDTLKAIKNVKWYPAWGENRITKMIEDRADWCISRQRTWGVPLPVYYCKKCGKPYITRESIDKIKDVVFNEGTNAWWMKDVKELLPENAKCECGHTEFEKDTDIMDVWFDSGSTHYSVVKQRNLPDIDLYLEGNDQYRGWFQSSLLTSIATEKKAPYKEVVTNGFLVDEKGHKMSKSIGNVVYPSDVIAEYGADILRLWVVSSEYRTDISISKDILKQVAESYRKIRNTMRFLIANTSDLDLSNLVEFDKQEEIDRWALHKLNKLIKNITNAYDNYEFNKAYLALVQFFTVDMSTFYLDFVKDRLYIENKNSLTRRSVQTSMYKILHCLARILAPIISFTAEDIWKYMLHTDKDNLESIMLNNYPKYKEKYTDSILDKKIEKLRKIKDEVQKQIEVMRKEKQIGQSLEASVKITAHNKEIFNFIKENEKLLKDMLIISSIEVDLKEEKNENEYTSEVTKTKGEKCERCWMYSEDIKDGLCQRCREVLKNIEE